MTVIRMSVASVTASLAAKRSLRCYWAVQEKWWRRETSVFTSFFG